MRVLITGANGQLGKALQRTLSGHDLILKDLQLLEKVIVCEDHCFDGFTFSLIALAQQVISESGLSFEIQLHCLTLSRLSPTMSM